MNWWTSFWNGVADAATTFENACNAVGEALSDLAETAQNKIQDGFDALGNALGAGPLFHAIGVWLAAPLGVFGAAIKGFCNAFGGYWGGAAKMVAAVMTLNGGLFLEGVGDIVSGIAGGFLLMTGEVVAYLQGAFLFVNERPLNPTEKEQMDKLFQGSIAYYNIRVIEPPWNGVAMVSGNRAITVGNRIYVKTGTMAELVHECTHVWQYQHLGARYASDALWAQVFQGYEWRLAVRQGTTKWLDLNRESQGQLIQDTWTNGGLLNRTTLHTDWNDGHYFEAVPPSSIGVWNPNDLSGAQIADDAIATIRGVKPFRLSRSLN